MGDFPSIPPADVSKPAPGTLGGVTAKTDPIVTVGGKKIKKSQFLVLKQLDRDNPQVSLAKILSGATITSTGNVIGLDLNGVKGIKNIRALAKLTYLKGLFLYNTGITNISSLGKLANLERLSVGGTAITSITPLARLIKLKRLYLWGTKITSVEALGAGHKNLEILYIRI